MKEILEALRQELPHDEIPSEPKQALRRIDAECRRLEDSGLRSDHDQAKWTLLTRAFVEITEAMRNEENEAA